MMTRARITDEPIHHLDLERGRKIPNLTPTNDRLLPDRWTSALRAAVVGLISAVMMSCAQDVGDIDRTQAGLLNKEIFSGDWFMRRTVIEVPYDVGYTFIGEQEEAVRVRWDIQKEFLIAYRVNPLVENTVDAAPAAVFAISEHVDVIRSYNEATGEQSNVIEENSDDSLWYQRKYVRVDWSKNLATNFAFYVDQLEQDPIQYYLDDPTKPDSLLLGVQNPDKTWKDVVDPKEIIELQAAQYLDVVTKVYVKPEKLEFDDGYGTITYEPACWYYLNYDCAPAILSIRNSFLRADAALSNYEPLEYPDNRVVRNETGDAIAVRWNAAGDREVVQPTAGTGRAPGNDSGAFSQTPTDPYSTTGDTAAVRMPFFDKFGYFRTERFGYNPQYGETESDRIYLINRWNIWENSLDEDGKPIPFSQRKIRPIVYYLSPNFPSELRFIAEQSVDQWNHAFETTVKALTGWSEVPEIFVLRDNTLSVDPETGAVQHRGQAIGDLRYSHLYLVSEPTRAGLLGYGPSAVDPYTGEIFAADSFIYGGPAMELAARGRDIVDLINGRLDVADLASGENISSYVSQLKGAVQQQGYDAQKIRKFAQTHKGAHSGASKKGDAKKIGSLSNLKDPKNVLKQPGIEKLIRPVGWISSRLAHVAGTPLEKMLGSDAEIVALKSMGLVDPFGGATALSGALAQKTSPVAWSSPTHRRATLKRFRSYSERNIMMATFFDDAVAGLALELKDQPRDELLQTLYAAILKSTAEHEIGHTLGLRHNFEGSTDALNYHDEYWKLRGENPPTNGTMTDAERNGKLRQYQYSSIMDYAGRFNADIAGLGHYDDAAIAFGYGQLVEVFDTPLLEPLVEVVETDEDVFERPLMPQDVFRGYRHYSQIPKMLGGTANIPKRKLVAYTISTAQLMGDTTGHTSIEAQLVGETSWNHWEVPYRFCSDEYVFGTPTCHAYDMGADPFEVVQDAVERYRNYYWFNNFKRDRVFFDEWDYMDDMYWRYFSFIQNAYHSWVFAQWFKTDMWEWLRQDAERYAIEDKPWTEALDGGLAYTAAVDKGLTFLWEVLATPEPGAYMYDFDEGYYWSLSGAPIQQCAPGVDAYYVEEDEPLCVDANLSLGSARHFLSLYDVDSGYYFYERLKWIGSFYDKVLALETLTSPDTYLLGVDTAQSVGEWAISMYLSFPIEIQRLFSGIAADRFDMFAGVFDAKGNYSAPDPTKPVIHDPNSKIGGPVDPSTSFTVQLYSLWYGMAWLNANFDNTFNNFAKIWLKGSAEEFDLTGIDPSQVIEFQDPLYNKTYVAIRPPTGYWDDSQTEESSLDGVGWTMLKQAEVFKQDYLTDKDDPFWGPYYKWRLQNILENIEVVRGMYDLYGYLVW